MKRLLLSVVLLFTAYWLQAQTAALYATGFHQPNSLALDAAGNLYVATYGDNSVVKTSTAGAVVATYTGFNDPFGLAFDEAGNLYVGRFLWPNANLSILLNNAHKCNSVLFYHFAIKSW